MFRTAKFQLIEIKVPAGLTGQNNVIAFEQQPQLQSIAGDKTIWVKAFESFNVFDLSTSPLTPGNPVAAYADLANTVITFRLLGTDFVKQVPLNVFHRIKTTAGALASEDPAAIDVSPDQLFLFYDVSTIDWTNSYVTILQTPITTPPFSYVFGVHYDYQGG